MRAVVCPELGPLDTLVIEDRAVAEPTEGLVVVDVRAAGVNFVDGLICQGTYQLKPDAPFVPGSEIAGVVAAVGPGVAGVDVGDRVIAFVGFGGFAEQVTVPALSLVRLPDAVDFARGAALLQSYCTMLFTLTRRTSVRPGEWVLVLGAGGGIGLAAVDVFESEPPMAGQPLLRMENVVATPHLGYVEKSSYELYFGAAFRNLVAYAAGAPEHVVNPQALAARG